MKHIQASCIWKYKVFKLLVHLNTWVHRWQWTRWLSRCRCCNLKGEPGGCLHNKLSVGIKLQYSGIIQMKSYSINLGMERLTRVELFVTLGSYWIVAGLPALSLLSHSHASQVSVISGGPRGKSETKRMRYAANYVERIQPQGRGRSLLVKLAAGKVYGLAEVSSNHHPAKTQISFPFHGAMNILLLV